MDIHVELLAFMNMVAGLMAVMIGFITTGEILRWVWRNATLQLSFAWLVILCFVFTHGGYEDIEPFINFFRDSYEFSLDDKFNDLLVLIGCFVLLDDIIWGAYSNRHVVFMIRVRAGLQTLVDAMHIFYSLEDECHVDKGPKKAKKSIPGIPKALRPVAIFLERPQPVPLQQPDSDEPNLRSISGASGSGSCPSNMGSGSRGRRGKGRKK